MLIYSKQDTIQTEQAAMLAGISQQRLMENAGSSVAKAIRTRFNCESLKVVVLCGNGNNGGDGFVAARRLHQDGARVTVILTDGKPASDVSSDMLQYVVGMGLPIIDAQYETERSKSCILGADVVIDSMYGFGFRGQFNDTVSKIAAATNQSKAFVVSVDVPSGVVCDSGACAVNAIIADLTVTFIAHKLCHVIYPSANNCGEVLLADIGIPSDKYVKPSYNVIDKVVAQKLLPMRPIDGHKGTFGTVHAVCGSYGMCGAAEFAANAALKSGAGLVKMSVSDGVYRVLASRMPEAVYDVCTPIGQPNLDFSCARRILKTAKKSDSVLIGCGCGNNEDVFGILETVVCNVNCPVVIDADGINALSRNIDLLRNADCEIVLTPHYGEMARLCGVSIEQLMSDRLHYGSMIADTYGVVVVLKGARTLIFAPDGEIFVNLNCNDGMATAGSGDMLAGIIASLLAQGVSATDAAKAGVYIHGFCGDITAEKLSKRSMTVTDMLNNLHEAFSQLDNDGND